MPWAAGAPQAGFSSANRTWLKLDPVHTGFAVDRQAADPASTLGYTRALLALRRQHPALMHGHSDVLDTPGDIVAFVRRSAGGAMLCAFNLGEAAVDWSPPPELGALRLLASESAVGHDGAVPDRLLPGSGYWAALES